MKTIKPIPKSKRKKPTRLSIEQTTFKESIAEQTASLTKLIASAVEFELESAFCRGVVHQLNTSKDNEGQCPVCKDYNNFLGTEDSSRIPKGFIKCLSCCSMLNQDFVSCPSCKSILNSNHLRKPHNETIQRR